MTGTICALHILCNVLKFVKFEDLKPKRDVSSWKIFCICTKNTRFVTGLAAGGFWRNYTGSWTILSEWHFLNITSMKPMDIILVRISITIKCDDFL